MRAHIRCLGILMAFGFMILAGGGCATKDDIRKDLDQRFQIVEQEVEENQLKIDELFSVSELQKTQLENQDSRQEQLAGDFSKLKASLPEEGTTGERVQEAANPATEQTFGTGDIDATLSFSEAIQFGFDKWDLSEEAKGKIDEVTQRLQDLNSYLITLEGHTDSTGPPTYNFLLGKKRAETVYRYMVNKEVPVYSLYTISFSEDKPIVSNDKKENRAANRRVEIKVYSLSIK